MKALKELQFRIKLKGFILLAMTAVSFFIFLVFIIKTMEWRLPDFIESLTGGDSFGPVLLIPLYSTLFLLYLSTKYWPFGGDENIIPASYLLHLARVINGEYCKVLHIKGIYKKGKVEGYDLHFSFKNQNLILEGIEKSLIESLHRNDFFSIILMPYYKEKGKKGSFPLIKKMVDAC